MNKRGVSQVFTFIFIAVLIGFVLYFGFTMVEKFKDFSEKGELLKFEEDFKKKVDNVYSLDVGSMIEYSRESRYKTMVVPSDIKEICVEESKVILEFEDKSKDFFIVPNLSGNECFNALRGFSFVLENKVVEEEVVVEIKNVE